MRAPEGPAVSKARVTIRETEVPLNNRTSPAAWSDMRSVRIPSPTRSASWVTTISSIRASPMF